MAAICLFDSSHREKAVSGVQRGIRITKHDRAAEKFPEKEYLYPGKIFRNGTYPLSDRLLGSLRAQSAARDRPLCPQCRAGVEPLPAAVVDPRQVRHRRRARAGRQDARRRRDRTVLQYGQCGVVCAEGHHHRRAGFRGALPEHTQHYRTAFPGRKDGGGVFPQEGIPALRVLRYARRRVVRRAVAGIPRDGACGEPRIQFFCPGQKLPERVVELRSRAVGGLAACVAETGRCHGLRRQPRLSYHRSLPAARGGGKNCAFRTISRCSAWTTTRRSAACRSRISRR